LIKQVLFVFEGGGATSIHTRGSIYKELFAAQGISARYIPHHFEPPLWLIQPRGAITQQFMQSFECKLLLRGFDALAWRINERRILRMARQADAVVFVKVSSLALVKRIRRESRARLVYDVSDALWLPYLAKFYGDIGAILGMVDAVTWDYQYSFEFAQRYSSSLFHWPPASQVEFFDLHRRPKPSSASDQIRLGWVGSPGTAFSLHLIWEALEKLAGKYPNIHLRLVGTGPERIVIPHFEKVSYSVCPYYSPQQMIDEILQMDIGLFPLFDVEDSRVRGFIKALVYMSGEAAVVASPRGLVVDLIHDGTNGMLAECTAEWIQKLESLITNSALRKSIAARGLETAREFSLQNSFAGLMRALDL
jgi:glycosyltransferase involved in cell wall biosynthesis